MKGLKMDIKMPDTAQVLAFGRHIVSYGAGIATGVSVLGLWQNPQDMANAQHAVKLISDGFAEVVTGFGILIPIAMGVFAAIKANPMVQMLIGATSILKGQSDTSKLTVADQKTIAKATEALPMVETVTVTPTKGL